jgi:hypothetical protein
VKVALHARWKVKEHKGKPKETICYILAGDTVVAKGKAMCNLKADRFDKNAGRKLSMARALEAMPKAVRTAFWAKLHQKVGLATASPIGPTAL